MLPIRRPDRRAGPRAAAYCSAATAAKHPIRRADSGAAQPFAAAEHPTRAKGVVCHGAILHLSPVPI